MNLDYNIIRKNHYNKLREKYQKAFKDANGNTPPPSKSSYLERYKKELSEFYQSTRMVNGMRSESSTALKEVKIGLNFTIQPKMAKSHHLTTCTKFLSMVTKKTKP